MIRSKLLLCVVTGLLACSGLSACQSHDYQTGKSYDTPVSLAQLDEAALLKKGRPYYPLPPKPSQSSGTTSLVPPGLTDSTSTTDSKRTSS
jgi:hypothetical protein